MQTHKIYEFYSHLLLNREKGNISCCIAIQRRIEVSMSREGGYPPKHQDNVEENFK
jgi:hypothetical protein